MVVAELGKNRVTGDVPRSAFIPLAAFSALVVFLYLRPGEIVLGGMHWIPVVNMVLTTLGALLVAGLAAASCLVGNEAAIMPLGAGMLAFGVSSLAANLVLLEGRHDSAIAIVNLGYAIAGLSSLFAAGRLLWLPGMVPRVRPLGSLISGYGGILLLVAAILWASLKGILPTFFVPGVGSTWVRFLVLGVAIAAFSSTSGLLWIVARRNRSVFLSWYSLGMALLAVSMTGAFGYTRIDSLAGWTVRAAVYAGSAYMVVAMVIAVRQSGRWVIPLNDLRETRVRYASLVNTMPDAILVHSEGRCVFANPAAAALFGAGDPREIMGRRVVDLVHPDSHRLVLSGISGDTPTGKSSGLEVVKLVRLDGVPVAAEMVAAAVEHNRKPAVQIVLHDIRGRQRAAEELARSHLRLTQMLDSIQDDFYVLDRNWVFLFASRRFTSRIGKEPQDFVGRSIWNMFPRHLGTVLEDNFRAAMEKREIRRFEIGGQYTDAWYSIAAFPSPEGLTVLGTDISERKKAELELKRLNETLEGRVAERTAEAESRARQLQALAVQLITAEEQERRRIVLVLHDDLQQILASCKMQLPTPDSLQGAGEHAHGALQQVSQLLDESLRCCRLLTQDLSPPALQHGGVLPAIQGLAARMRDRHGLAVSVRSTPPDQRLQISMGLFVYRAVQEMLFNVVKHSGVAEASVRLEKVADRLEVVVADLGRGFDPSMLKAPAGVPPGVGLLSIEERSRSLGGSLSIDSAPGRGSRLTLSLPLAPPVEQADADAREARGRESPGPALSAPDAAASASVCYRVLLVDDHKVMREGLAAALEGQPGIVIVGHAADGLEAIDKARALAPDVILMDIRMPRMGGIEATRSIKAAQPGIRVIGLAMYTEEDAIDAMRDAGAETLLDKSCSIETVLEAICRLSG
jgi:PAS domain S-box-containing protein